MRKIALAALLAFAFTLVGAVVVTACNQKPNPHVEWPPMDESWGASRDAGALDSR